MPSQSPNEAKSVDEILTGTPMDYNDHGDPLYIEDVLGSAYVDYVGSVSDALRLLIEKEVIGENETRPSGNGSSSTVRRIVSKNDLRAEQRAKLKEVMGEE